MRPGRARNWRGYTAGRTALALGDTDGFNAALQRLRLIGDRDVGDPLDRAAYHAAALHAHRAAAEGRPDDAIAILTGPDRTLLKNHEAFLLARLLDDLGRHRRRRPLVPGPTRVPERCLSRSPPRRRRPPPHHPLSPHATLSGSGPSDYVVVLDTAGPYPGSETRSPR